jgi:pilus assembly protein TadC
VDKNLNRALAVTFISFYTTVAAVLLHNLVSGLFEMEEAVFFMLAMASIFVFPFAFIVATTLWLKSRKQEKKSSPPQSKRRR